jgi:dihydroflavonol-4-reductase
MTVVVTGTCGHIGANLIRALIDNGRPVRSLVHVHNRGLDGLDTRLVKGDVLDPESLNRAFDGAEVVYHLAGCISLSMGDWPQLEAVNVVGTRNVVEACLQSGVKRLVHFSSIHALQQEPFSVPVDESRPLSESPDFPPYDRSKALGEREVQHGIEKGLNAVILNPTAIIGPYDYEPSYLGRALLDMARRKLPALVKGGYDWVDVRDVVQGAISAEKKGTCGERYLLSGHWVSLGDIAGKVSEITGTPPPRFNFPVWFARLGVPAVSVFSMLTGKTPLYTSFSLKAVQSNHHISYQKASRELGYQPRPFHETIADTLQWFRDNGQLSAPMTKESGKSA